MPPRAKGSGVREQAPRWSRASRLPRLPQAGKKASEGKRGVGGGLPGSRAPSREARAEPPMTTLCVLSRGIGGKDPTATPIARAQGRPGPRSHSPAATAEGPGALEFPPASARVRAPPAGRTDRTGRGLGSSGTSPHGPRVAASDPVTCGARPSPVSLRLQERATPAALGHQPDLISGFPKYLSHVVHGARPIPTSEETRE